VCEGVLDHLNQGEGERSGVQHQKVQLIVKSKTYLVSIADRLSSPSSKIPDPQYHLNMIRIASRKSLEKLVVCKTRAGFDIVWWLLGFLTKNYVIK